VGIRFCGEKRVTYEDMEPPVCDLHATLAPIFEDGILKDVDQHSKTTSGINVTTLPIYYKLLKAMIFDVPWSMKQFTHLCLPTLPLSTEKHVAALIEGLMKHVDAPSFHKACCDFHSTALHLSFALGHSFAKPCRPMCRTESEACDKCGFISKHPICFSCALLESGGAGTVSMSNQSSDKGESEEFLVSRDNLTNCCINVLRHVGARELTTGIELLIGVALDLSTQPEWQEFWNNNPPSSGWRCRNCFGTNEKFRQVCCICAKPNGQVDSDSSSSD